MKISVIMPVYNNSIYLHDCIESILNQTYENWEFIIIDDCSTEPVWETLQHYASLDERIKIYKNPTNFGLTKSLNIGLDLATGEVIARQDSDDMSSPTRFEKQIEAFQHPGVGLVSSWARTVHEEFPRTKLRLLDDYTDNVIRLNEDLIKSTLLEKNCIMGPAAMYLREVVDKIGYYDETLYYSQDYNYWLRIAQFFNIKIIPEDLYYRRKNIKSVRENPRHAHRKENLHSRVLQRAKEYPVIMKKTNKSPDWEFNQDQTRITYHSQEAYQKAQEFTSHTHDVYSDLPRNTDTVDKILTFNPDTKIILDAGCREGLLVEVLKQRGFDTLGIDISSISVSYAQSLGRDVIHGDIHQLKDFINRKFDAIISVHSLEHCHTPEKVIEEFSLALNEQGLIGIRVPLQRDLVDQSYFISQREKGPGGLPAHAVKFTPQSIQTLLENGNFEVLHTSFHRKGHERYEEYTVIARKIS